jgi:hypothetical protein
MAFGENHDSTNGAAYNSVHAEEAALNKLPSLPPRKKKPKIDILVIRTTHNGYLGISRPCIRCTMLLYKLVPAKGYTLGSVYYTQSNDMLVKTNIKELIIQHQKDPHISLYYRMRNIKNEDKFKQSY